MSSSKVPEVTLACWVMKVAATTLGETGGDAVSMTMHLGYALSSLIFLAFFLVTATVQLSSRTFQPFLFWSVIVATTTAGTTMADFADRSQNRLRRYLVLLAELSNCVLTVGTFVLDRFQLTGSSRGRQRRSTGRPSSSPRYWRLSSLLISTPISLALCYSGWRSYSPVRLARH